MEALLGGALMVVIVGSCTATVGAQEAPTTTEPSAPSIPIIVPAPTPAPVVDESLDKILHADGTAACAASTPGPTEELVPEGCWGRFPSSNYDIGCDEGAWNHLSRKVYCTFTDLAFQGARTATAAAAWLAGWAYSFDAAALVTNPAITMANAFDNRLVGPLDVRDLCWFLMVVWVALTALRGRVTHAAGEFVTSALLAGLAGLMLANPGGYLNGTFDTMSRLSTITLASGTGHEPPTTSAESGLVVAPIQAELHHAFVEEPYDVLDWGTTVMEPACATVRDQIVATGPHGSDDAPRDAMSAAGCDELADFNHDPSAERLFGAVLAFFAAAIMAVLVGLVALTVVVAQLAVAVAFVALPFAAAVAVLPGSGRSLAVRWMVMILRSVLAMVGMSFLLAVMLMLIQALLAGSDSMPLFARFTLVDVSVVVAILARKRLISAGHGFAAGVGAPQPPPDPEPEAAPRRPISAAERLAYRASGSPRQPAPSRPDEFTEACRRPGRYKLQERAYGRRAGQTHATEHSTVTAGGAKPDRRPCRPHADHATSATAAQQDRRTGGGAARDHRSCRRGCETTSDRRSADRRRWLAAVVAVLALLAVAPLAAIVITLAGTPPSAAGTFSATYLHRLSPPTSPPPTGAMASIGRSSLASDSRVRPRSDLRWTDRQHRERRTAHRRRRPRRLEQHPSRANAGWWISLARRPDVGPRHRADAVHHLDLGRVGRRRQRQWGHVAPQHQRRHGRRRRSAVWT